jgi:hypothetical protein
MYIYIPSNNKTKINTDLEGMWIREEMAQFEILARHYTGNTT